MKKFYLLLAFGLFYCVVTGLAQGTFTAIRSGRLTNPTTWDINGVPPHPCNNCTITISSGLTDTLDGSVELQGNGQIFVSANTTVVILNSNQLSFPLGFNAILDTLPGNTKVFLATSTSIVDASKAGPYDGIFTQNGKFSIITKLVGNAPLVFTSSGDIVVTSPPAFKIIHGPSTLSSGGTLPITLTGFNAVLDKDVVDLSWTTSQEINSDHFGVERSTDQSHWQTIGTVAAQGFSDIQVNYSFTDQSPASGINYYRLQMVDKDGQYAYSQVRAVRGSVIKGLVVSPNPASDMVTVSIGNDVTTNLTIALINQFGQVLQQKQISNPAGSSVVLSVGLYPQGTYILQIIGADGTRQVNKLLITH